MSESQNYSISIEDRLILRELGKTYTEFAADPLNRENMNCWKKLNDLKSVKPMVWLFEVPWNEMDVNDELKLRCVGEFAKGIENKLRRDIYYWRHMRGDMVLNPVFTVPPLIENSGFGIGEDVDIARTDADNDVVSRHFNILINDEKDIEKIKYPEISLNEKGWNEMYSELSETFDDVLSVRKCGVKHTSIAPWDFLVRLTGVEEVLMDMCVRPEYIHKLMDHLTNAHMRQLERYEELNILDLNNEINLGGGPQFTSELPKPAYRPDNVRTIDMWGRTMSQIFSSVSPDMHEEFALQYECRYLSRFGLTYYGCCEPLHMKMGILRKNVPNLRKVSMSPWVDIEIAAENVGADYVFSLKHNPALLAENVWDPEHVRKDLECIMEKLKGMHVEIIMKDISTVGHEPQRLWEWSKIASEVAEKYVYSA